MFYPGPPPPIVEYSRPHGEVFPANRKPRIKKCLDRTKECLVGLEYIVEITPTTDSRLWYSCRLCQIELRNGKDERSMDESVIRHIRLMSHKLNFLSKHFPRVKKSMSEPSRNITEEGIDRIVEKIEKKFGRMKAKLVIGSEIFQSKIAEIDFAIENGNHFVEDDDFVESFVKKRKRSKSSHRSSKKYDGKRKKDEQECSDKKSSKSDKKRKSSKSEGKRKRSKSRQSLSDSDSSSCSDKKYSKSSRKRKSRKSEEKRKRSKSRRRISRSSSSDRGKPPKSGKNNKSSKSEAVSTSSSRSGEKLNNSQRLLMKSSSPIKDEVESDCSSSPSPIRRNNQPEEYRVKSKTNNDNIQGQPRKLSLENRVTVPSIKQRVSTEEEDVIVLDNDTVSEGVGGNKKKPLNESSGSSVKAASGLELHNEDVTLISTLRFLSSLQSGGCLGEGLGLRLTQLLQTALTKESEIFGSSEALVQERECSGLLDQVMGRLETKLRHNIVGPGHTQAARIAVSKVKVLLGRRGVHREEILEIDRTTEKEAAIRRRVEQEVRERGLSVSARELSALVEAECVRERLRLPRLESVESQPVVQESHLSRRYIPPHIPPYIPPCIPPAPQVVNWAVIPGASPSMSSTASQPGSLLTPDQSIASTSSVASSQSNIMASSRPQAHQGVVAKVEPKEMESLNEDELVILIKNFKKLDHDEQRELVDYLKILEKSDPNKVSRLKKNGCTFR